MYYTPWMFPYPYHPNDYCANVPMYNNYIRQPYYWNIYDDPRNKIKDYGRKPFVVNINEICEAKQYLSNGFMDRKSFASYIDES